MINVTLGEVKKQTKEKYPILKKHHKSGGIFLFLSNHQCVCLQWDKNDGSWYVGEYYDCTNAEEFENFDNPITIQNA